MKTQQQIEELIDYSTLAGCAEEHAHTASLVIDVLKWVIDQPNHTDKFIADARKAGEDLRRSVRRDHSTN